MKIFNIKLFAGFLFWGLMVFTACNETTTPTDNSPYISSISKSSGVIGDIITINGTDFGLATDPGSVYFNQGSTKIQAKGEIGATNSDYISWTETQIKVKVPTGTLDGANKIQVYNGATSLYSNQVDFNVGAPPTGPTKAEATSKSSTSVIIAWTPSTDAKVVKYKVYYNDGSGYKFVSTTNNNATITGLTEGVVYTFEVKAVTATGLESAEDVSVDWSPASRFDGTKSMKMYETDSDFGSGIDLYDAAADGPVNRTAAEKSKWNIAINTNSGILFQTGSAITVGSGTAQFTELGSAFYKDMAALDNAMDSLPLNEIFDGLGNKIVFSEQSQNLTNSAFGSGNVVFVLRTKEANGKFYYAKVLLKKVNGSFLQGTAKDRYVECEISYQKVADVPYARVIQ